MCLMMRELYVESRIKSWTEAKEERAELSLQWEQLYEKIQENIEGDRFSKRSPGECIYIPVSPCG